MPTSRPTRLLESTDTLCPQCGYNLRQNISGTCPECPAARIPVIERTRLGLILMSLIPVSAAFVYCLSRVISRADATTSILLVTFGIETILGAATLVSLCIARRIHFVTSVLFFGQFTVIITSILISNIILIPTATVVASSILMFVLLSGGIAGLIIEIICDRKFRSGSQIEFSSSKPGAL